MSRDADRDGAPGQRRADASPTRLDGWKAIAAYLGREIRTVQRWEQSEGLPVHRLEHKQRASAYAFANELDAWVAARVPEHKAETVAPAPADGPSGTSGPFRPSRPGAMFLVVGATLFVVVIAGLVVSRWHGAASGDGDTADATAFAAFAEGRALYLSRQYSDAAVSLERSVTQDPNFGAAWAWLAKTYGRLAQPVWAGGQQATERARDAAQRAVALAPGSADAQVALALAARARGDIENVRSRANNALALDDRAAEALALLGDSYSAVVYGCHASQDPVLAEDYYRRSMVLMPNLTTTASNRAGNLRRMGKYAECVDLLNKHMRAYRDETPLLAVRGACRLMLGDVAGAREDIEPLRNNPNIAGPGSLVYLGLLAIRTGDVDAGVRDLEAFTQYDRSARTELIAAEAYGLGGDVDRAAVHLRRAFDLDPLCRGMVATSVAFASIRKAPPVAALLGKHRS